MPPLAAPHPEPLTFTDFELYTAGMHKVELSKRVLLMQMAVFLQCHTAVGACFDNGEAVELSPPVRHGMGFQGFDDQPLVGINLAYLRPPHGASFFPGSGYP
jgi:hypothetical protein